MGEPPTIEPVTPPPRPLPGPALQARRDARLGRRADRGAGRRPAPSTRSTSRALTGHGRRRRDRPGFYRRIAEAFPDAWLEDPDLEPDEAREALRPFEDRITWDAPIHASTTSSRCPCSPRTVNLKPSRFGACERCSTPTSSATQRGMGAYGGGQYELGVGRGQIQYLAALFHPTRPTTSLPPATTRSIPSRACRRARSIPTPSPPASAGGRRLERYHGPQAATDQDGAEGRAGCDAAAGVAGPTRSWRRRPASAPPRRRSSGRAPRSAWTPSARASTSARRSPPPGRRSACSCGAWPRPRWRWPSAARAT